MMSPIQYDIISDAIEALECIGAQFGCACSIKFEALERGED